MIISLIRFSASEIHVSHNILDNVELRSEILNIGLCSKETPYEMVGRTNAPTFSAKILARYSVISESVATGKCAPCCSRDPTGMMARLILLSVTQKSWSVIPNTGADIMRYAGLCPLTTFCSFVAGRFFIFFDIDLPPVHFKFVFKVKFDSIKKRRSFKFLTLFLDGVKCVMGRYLERFLVDYWPLVEVFSYEVRGASYYLGTPLVCLNICICSGKCREK